MNLKDTFSFFYQGQGYFRVYTKLATGYVYYKNKKINLVTGQTEFSDINEILKRLDSIHLNQDYKRTIYHFTYEWGLAQKSMPVGDEEPLVVFLHYLEDQEFKFESNSSSSKLRVLEKVPFDFYNKQFKKIYQHLLLGNCYQVNLTNKFRFHLDDINSLFKIFNHTQNIGAFAHGTNLPCLNQLIISNSPECLFKIKNKNIYTYPIKGTTTQDKQSLKKLLKSKKNQAELFMITDLMTNDLASLGVLPVEVLKKKVVLKVPHLYHTYSVIRARLNPNLKLSTLIDKIFPGGSITGAPKKRVMEIIKELEPNPRGIYCGSTLLLDGKIKTASINIRTASIDLKNKILEYGAGGGITLRSNAKVEYEEMNKKLNSFIDLLR